MIESNRRVPLTEVRTDRLKIGEYTFILNDVVKEGDKVKEYKTELIGDGGTCLVYRSFMSNGDVKKKVILKEFYPLFNDVNYIPEIDRNIETGELLISEMHKQDDIFQKKLKRFEDSYYTFNELHNDETMNNNSINVMDIVRANNTIYMIIDYNNFMDLFEYMKEEISFYDFLHILQKTASAVGKLHKMDGGGYLHTDITPCNIAVVKEDKYVRLIDSDAMVKRADIEYLNQQREECDEYEIIFSNSQGYSGPEMYMGVKSKIECLYECGPATDVFAIGAILYYYLYGQKISFTNNNGLVREKVINELQKYAYKKELAEKVKEKYAYSSLHTIDLIDKFMEKCLASNIYDRYQDMDEVVEALMKIKKLVEPQTVYIKENFHKNPNKVFGRDGKLKELSEKLQVDGTEGKENKNHLVCISAIGGMGKSALAKLYAEENMDKYDVILEVWAENAKNALLAVEIINYPEAEIIRFDALKDKYRFGQWKYIVSELMKESKTLLIVHDYNMNDEEENKDFEIWHELPCDIILTSRDMYSNLKKTVRLNFSDLIEYDKNAAIDMFKMYYYQSALIKNNKKELELLEKKVNDSDIKELTEMLSHHPFSIKVLAKQMAKGKYTSAKMLEELKIEGLKSHRGAKFNNDGVIDERDHDYGKIDAYGHIQKIFNIAARNEKLDDEEKEILRYMILVPSVDGISVGRLIEWCDLDECETEGLLEGLEEKGWIEKVEDGVDYLYCGDESKSTVYRMPLVIAEALKEQKEVVPVVDNVKRYVDESIRMILESAQNASVREYMYNIKIWLLKYIKREYSLGYIEILIRTATVIDGIEAKKIYLLAMELCEALLIENYGDEEMEIGVYFHIYLVLERMGNLFLEKGDTFHALYCCEEMEEIQQKYFSCSSYFKCAICNQKGRVYRVQGCWDKASECFKESIKHYAKVREELSEWYAWLEMIPCYDFLAGLKWKEKKYEEASEYYRSIIELGEKIDSYGDIANAHRYLGDMYVEMGKYEDALMELKRAYEIWKSRRGEQYIETLLTYSKIGEMYYIMENYEEALKIFTECIENGERTFGVGTKIFSELYMILSKVHKKLGNAVSAQECIVMAKNYKK